MFRIRIIWSDPDNEDNFFKFSFLTSFFHSTSLQVNNEKLFTKNILFVFMFMCIMLFESLVKIKIKSRLYCVDFHDVNFR